VAERFLARGFTPAEQAACDGRRDRAAAYAARFAAKEAVGKALGIGIIGIVWRDIEVLSGGKPLIALHGGVADIARRLGVARVEVSLSHTGGMAYAVAAALKEDADG
jgi:holo-[acyl-carrier protein] synthase